MKVTLKTMYEQIGEMLENMETLRSQELEDILLMITMTRGSLYLL